MSVSGNKHSLLGQPGNLTSKGWIIIFFRGEITAEQNHEREATGKKWFQQVLPTIFVRCFKKIIAQAIAHQTRSCTTLRWEKKFMPQKIDQPPPSPQKNNGPPL